MMFLAGFAACQVSGASPIVLLLLMAFVAAGAVVCACFFGDGAISAGRFDAGSALTNCG